MNTIAWRLKSYARTNFQEPHGDCELYQAEDDQLILYKAHEMKYFEIEDGDEEEQLKHVLDEDDFVRVMAQLGKKARVEI